MHSDKDATANCDHLERDVPDRSTHDTGRTFMVRRRAIVGRTFTDRRATVKLGPAFAARFDRPTVKANTTFDALYRGPTVKLGPTFDLSRGPAARVGDTLQFSGGGSMQDHGEPAGAVASRGIAQAVRCAVSEAQTCGWTIRAVKGERAIRHRETVSL